MGKHVQTPWTNFSISRDANQIVSILCPNDIYTIYRMLKKEIRESFLGLVYHKMKQFLLYNHRHCFIQESHILRVFLMWSLMLLCWLIKVCLRNEFLLKRVSKNTEKGLCSWLLNNEEFLYQRKHILRVLWWTLLTI